MMDRRPAAEVVSAVSTPDRTSHHRPSGSPWRISSSPAGTILVEAASSRDGKEAGHHGPGRGRRMRSLTAFVVATSWGIPSVRRPSDTRIRGAAQRATNLPVRAANPRLSCPPMSLQGMRAAQSSMSANGGQGGSGPRQAAAVLGAVRDDLRQTLRCGWIDPVFDAAAGDPVFFTAAWSAIRPNVGKSFLTLARTLREEAVNHVEGRSRIPDLRRQLEADLEEEELRRLEDCARASHQVTGKVQLVVHALLRAVRRDRISGTGREEPPVRRGVPEWQRWMSFQPNLDGNAPVIEEILSSMSLPAVPASLRLFGRWPAALTTLWDELGPVTGGERWSSGALALRRTVLAGMSTLPHPVELQWMALKERGFGEDERARLAEVLVAHDAAMAHHSLIAAFAWLALGSPEIGAEG